jgi:hypothetical protein
LPCGNECPINLTGPKDCILNAERQIVSSTFDMKAIKPNIGILDVDPFMLYYRKNNKKSYAQLVIYA